MTSDNLCSEAMPVNTGIHSLEDRSVEFLIPEECFLKKVLIFLKKNGIVVIGMRSAFKAHISPVGGAGWRGAAAFQKEVQQ